MREEKKTGKKPPAKRPVASPKASEAKPQPQAASAKQTDGQKTQKQPLKPVSSAIRKSSPGGRVIPEKPNKPARPRKQLKIPPILLEGDTAPAPLVSGPGARYSLTVEPVSTPFPATTGDLPEAYGTGRLFLAARDPHWLYASWDLMEDQQRDLNSRSRDGHLVLRVFARNEQTPMGVDIHVHPESRNWFIHVPRAETHYHAELGYYDRNRTWQSVCRSQSTYTPPDSPSPDVTAEFATIPADVTFQEIVEMVQEFVTERQPLLEAVVYAQEFEQQLAAAGSEGKRESEAESKALAQAPARPPAGGETRGKRKKPSVGSIRIEPGKRWTPAQRQALADLITIDRQRRVWMGSLEITELVRRSLEEETASIAAAELARGAGPEQLPGGIGGISSFGGQVPPGRKFWFRVNAELIVYGATEPDATVMIADRPVKLRPDGTFSFRFSLPDGRYELPALAISRDGEDGREARLEFSRSTDYRGVVEPHAQDPKLRSPRPENI
jgi:hypothetical protein